LTCIEEISIGVGTSKEAIRILANDFLWLELFKNTTYNAGILWAGRFKATSQPGCLKTHSERGKALVFSNTSSVY
jgi:hypothetical protein